MSVAEVTEQAPKHQGSLEKQNRLTRAWKKYWFILKDDTLTYVRNQDKKIDNSQIDMSSVQTVRATGNKNGYQFEVVTKNKTLYLSAATAEQRDSWIRVLHESMIWNSRKGSSHSTSSSCSTRPSCNSVSDDPNYRQSCASSANPELHRSSGYSTTSSRMSDAVSSQSELRNSKDSDAEDDVFFSGTSAGEQTVVKNRVTRIADKSRHQLLRRNPAAAPPPKDDDPYLNSKEFSGVYTSIHEPKLNVTGLVVKGYANVGAATSPVREADSVQLYDSVHEPVTLAISHIVKGYVNIKRNLGPQEGQDEIGDGGERQRGKEPEDVVPAEEECNYTSSDNDARSSTRPSVVMRRSNLSRRLCSDYSSITDDSETTDRDSEVSSVTIDRLSAAKQAIADVAKCLDFHPVEDLPHPRMELTHQTAFDKIRYFLASHRGPDEFYTSVERNELDGRHVNALKEYLNAHSY